MASTEATSSSGPVQTQPDEASSQGEPQQAEPASPAGEAEARRQQQPASTNPASPPAQGPPPAVAALSTRIDSNANASNSAPLIARSQGERGCMDCDCLPWASHPLFDAAAQVSEPHTLPAHLHLYCTPLWRSEPAPGCASQHGAVSEVCLCVCVCVRVPNRAIGRQCPQCSKRTFA